MVNGTFKSLAEMNAAALRRVASNMKVGLKRRSMVKAEIKRRGLIPLPQVAARRGRTIAKRFIKRTRKRRIIG